MCCPSPIFGRLPRGCHQHQSTTYFSSWAKLGICSVLRVYRPCSSGHMTNRVRPYPLRKPLNLDSESQRQASTDLRID